jgi:tetratricopeptide (TPR) repeat protein
MSDRDMLLKFIETHYDDEGLARLARAVGLDRLSGETLPARADALLLGVEREGMAGALLVRLERDHPQEMPTLEWAGARAGKGALTRPPTASAPAPSGAPRPLTGVSYEASPPVQVPQPDTVAAAPQESAQPAPAELDTTHIQAPLMALRDGVEALEAARRTTLPSAEAVVSVSTTSAEAAPEPTEDISQEPTLPFRFVHGYTLPTHWARREQEISELITEVRENRNRILSLVAIGGTGKSALTRKLLDELPSHNIRVDGALWFSFYVEPEFDRFLTEACRYLIPGFDPVAHPSPYEKGVLLREAMEKGHYLLVLDGIEVLLVSDRQRKDFGAFLDRALREFLEGVCEAKNSQVLTSSRWPLTDLMEKPGYRMLQLADLSSESAEELLLSYGVGGSEMDRNQICTRFGSHALTLQVLADYLTRFHEGDPQGTMQIQEFSLDAPQGIRLQAALDSYWQRLETDERFFLTRMSAFRGGVDERSFLVLNKKGDAFSPEFRQLVTRIIKSPLVSVERREGRPRLTAHPLIKTFFYERMGDNERGQTHRALKDYAQGLPLPDRPRTLADYEPLLEACHHCLQVGLYTEAYHIYRRNNMDNALRWWGHYAQAHALLEPLREASQGDAPAWQTERWQKSWVENETALLAMLRGNTEIALERFRNSADMDAKSGDGSGESASWQNVASVLTQRGDFWGALSALEKSQAIETTIGRYEKEDMLAGLEGVCHAELGQAQAALELLSRALGISMQRPNMRAMCYWTWRLGDLYLRVRQIDRALTNHMQALENAQREQFRDYEGHAQRGLGDVYRARHDYPIARQHYTDALRIARTLGNPYLENEVRLSLARMAEAEESWRDAQIQARQVLDRARESGYQVQETEANLILARAARHDHDAQELAIHTLTAHTLLEKTCHYWTRQEFDSILAKEPALRESLTSKG